MLGATPRQRKARSGSSAERALGALLRFISARPET
jgi:hypothetical protein